MAFLLILLVLTAYPIYGLVQVIDGLYRYAQKGHTPEYYREFANYLKMVVAYAVGAILLFQSPIGYYILEYTEAIHGIYLFLIPLPIAIYKRKITKNAARRNEAINILDDTVFLKL